METAQRQTIRVTDNRVLDTLVTGPVDGQALVFHHGTPGAYPQMQALTEHAHRLGLRVITYSRPGYGDSTRLAGRRVVDVVADTAALLDALRIERCLIAGWSGGGPHALACAARLPERATAALIIAGVAPYGAEGLDWMGQMGEDNVTEFGAARAGEDTLRPFLTSAAVGLRQVTAEGLITQLNTLLPPADRAQLTGQVGEDFAANFREAVRTGVDGWVDDDLAFVAPWGFALEEISIPTQLWQGSTDLMVPYAHGQWLAAHIPGVVAHLEEGEGHLSIGVGGMGRMLEALLAAAR